MDNNRILGIDFFGGSLQDAVARARSGGLCVAPSGPGLAGDLTSCSSYAEALTQADLVLPDSGLMCLWTKLFFSRPIRRISGLAFLRAYLKEGGEDLQDSFWIMPDHGQSIENVKWLREEIGFAPEEESIYVAPRYERIGPIEDLVLLERIKERKPSHVFIQLGGGVQERLGFFLRQNLVSRPAILCTGAALAFLSGEQAEIPDWADRLYLGWLLRCFSSPEVFVPRYLKAFRLITVLARNGRKLPELTDPLARA